MRRSPVQQQDTLKVVDLNREEAEDLATFLRQELSAARDCATRTCGLQWSPRGGTGVAWRFLSIRSCS